MVNNMNDDYYYHEFDDLIDDFNKNIQNYPLFKEIIDNIYDNDIKEINDLVNKNDIFYFKKAIDKLKDLNNYIINTSNYISKIYSEFEENVKIWEEIKDKCILKDDMLDKVNSYINKANSLIKESNLDKIKLALDYLNDAIKISKIYKEK